MWRVCGLCQTVCALLHTQSWWQELMVLYMSLDETQRKCRKLLSSKSCRLPEEISPDRAALYPNNDAFCSQQLPVTVCVLVIPTLQLLSFAKLSHFPYQCVDYSPSLLLVFPIGVPHLCHSLCCQDSSSFLQYCHSSRFPQPDKASSHSWASPSCG